MLRSGWCASSRGPPWTILRPAHVYGPYCRTMSAGVVTLPPIFRAFTQYLPGLTGGPRSTWCHVADAAAAAASVLGRPASFGRRFNVSDATPLAFGEVFTSMTEAYGLLVGPLFPFPGPTFQRLAGPLIDRDIVFDSTRTVLRQLWRRIQTEHGIRSPLRPRIDRKALLFAEGDTILGADALRELGWRPRYEDFRLGIVPTIKWYQERGWVPKYDTSAQLERQEGRAREGVVLTESYEGGLETADGQTRRVKLELDTEYPPPGRQWVQDGFLGHVDGVITLRGLAQDAALEGTVRYDLSLLGGGEIVYDFGFLGDDLREYRFWGRKRLGVMRTVGGWTRLEGGVATSRGESLGEGTLELVLSGRIVPMLMSLRHSRMARMMRAAAQQRRLNGDSA